jgi:hypothetical protein
MNTEPGVNHLDQLWHEWRMLKLRLAALEREITRVEGGGKPAVRPADTLPAWAMRGAEMPRRTHEPV